MLHTRRTRLNQIVDLLSMIGLTIATIIFMTAVAFL